MGQDSSSALGLVLLVYALVVVAFTALSIWVSVRIARKAGYSGWLAVLACLVPGASLVLMIMFAFSEWPVERAARLSGYPVAYPPSGPEEFSYQPLEHQAYGQQPLPTYPSGTYPGPYSPHPYGQPHLGQVPVGQPYGQPQMYDAPKPSGLGQADGGTGSPAGGTVPHAYGSYSADRDDEGFGRPPQA